MESEIVKVIITLVGIAAFGAASRKWKQAPTEGKQPHKENFPFPMVPTATTDRTQRSPGGFTLATENLSSYDDDMDDESMSQYTGVNTARAVPGSRYVPIDNAESAVDLYIDKLPNGAIVEGGKGGKLASSRPVTTIITDSTDHGNTEVGHPERFSIDLRTAVIYSEILEPKFKSY